MTRKQQALLTLLFFALTPLTTFILIWLRGLPSFAADRMGEVIVWVYGVTWVPAILAAVLLTAIVSVTTGKTGFFHRPYDFGRCFSLGAISGALTEALATWSYRAVSRHAFSDFWVAGAMIAGCLAGAFLTAAVLSSGAKRSAHA
jgi:hypothetical protein